MAEKYVKWDTVAKKRILVDDAGGGMPTGVILMWSGAIVDIPSGWLLCDGTNGTPDLRNKFIVGAGDTYAVNVAGGEATHVLSSAEMPAHTHVQDSHNHTQNSHNHTQDAHTHTQNAHNHGTVTDGGTTVANGAGNSFATVTSSGATGNVAVANATATNQNATATNQAATATNQATTATNQSTGGGGAHNNLPPYLALAYIMKS